MITPPIALLRPHGGSPRARALVLVCSLATACIGTNPDWDEPPVVAADDGGSTDDGDSTGGGDSTEGGDAGEAGGDETGGMQDVDTGAPGVDPATEPCLEQGLARCEDDTTVVCADLASDPNHCGSCFNDCSGIAGTLCVEGTCTCEGSDWLAVCDGACVNVKDDPRMCGVGCVDCTALGGDQAECKNGSCKFD